MGKRKNIAVTRRETQAQTLLAERAEIARRVHLSPAQRAAEDAALSVHAVDRARTYLAGQAITAGVIVFVVVGALTTWALGFAVLAAWGFAAWHFLRRPRPAVVPATVPYWTEAPTQRMPIVPVQRTGRHAR